MVLIMINTYELTFFARCPVDDQKIRYQIAIQVEDDKVWVEDIQESLAETEEWTTQEDLCAHLKARFHEQHAKVTIVGTHSGIKITSVA